MSKNESNRDYSQLADKEPTELHQNFAAWIKEKTGYEPDEKTVQLVCTLRMSFQASPENQSHLAHRKAQAAAKKKRAAAEKKARLEKQLAALQAELAKESATSTPAEKPAPAKKAAPAKPEDKPATPTRRTRKATAAKASEKAPTQPRAARTRKATAPKVTPDVPADFDADDLTDANNAKPARRRTRRAATPAAN
ncbi:hypothetical protein [Streptomyces sp. HNA39]|uniref:hypothetical protein n=1 Tax=Streptomyces sp. HNA39 TaxID=2850561 RepID=UPI00200DA971|nr:hypothetical protein [Streptomyces sp. HNA39]UQA37502.1 hypothetical protein KRR37_30090 [Streptomyces sp. HNA39]